MHLGIDYGSKLAGTTVICWDKDEKLYLAQSEKKQDADAFLQQHIEALRPGAVFMDAPLSLPGVYHQKGDDYFYRACDKATQAMSPMFLGGLTARAMRLRSQFPDLAFYETYPAQLVRTLFPENDFYKKENPALFAEQLAAWLPFPLTAVLSNWHQVDGMLAWLSGWRFSKGNALKYGKEEEGLIVV
ncbi:MAG: DUF429 domain-containing protein [Lewinellaceae bacterium]|nr:hypothetical protein [Saprospiraceae bacterium]MCB9338895.1 DUF429 domain-containing protein [Lewinellaceae bacterium]